MFAHTDLPTRHLTKAVEFLQGHDVDVRGNLEYGVGGGINNRMTGCQVLGTALVDDHGAGFGAVAEDALSAGRCAEGIDNVLGETVRIGREGCVEPQSGQFPVPGGGVLSG